jgi:GNAT superfamily N-acetyltransferase
MTTTCIVEFCRHPDDKDVPRAQVLALQAAAFECPIPELLPADQRWLGWRGGALVAHAAAQQRWFAVNGAYLRGWMLGGVCTRPEDQSQGIGGSLLQRVEADLRSRDGFVVLNCGERVRSFYERAGYICVAAGGRYVRGNGLQTDPDPALALSLHPQFSVDALRCEAFPFLLDF